LSALSFHKQFAIWEEMILIAYLGNLMKESKYTGIEAMQVWMRVILAA
jgi:hypothetical protein